MPKLLVFQHVAHEILGTLDPLLRAAGFRIRYVNFERHPAARPELDGYDGLVVFGGPMSADEVDVYPHLRHEIEVIREALDRDTPILGICLGAQLLARALGARVERAPLPEIGWHEVAVSEAASADPLLGHFAPVERLFQWHRDTFELPRDAVHLASSATCPNQAFRAAGCAYGFQFHLEVDVPMIERWLEASEDRTLGPRVSGGGNVDPERIRRETGERIQRQRELAEQTFAAFARMLRPVCRARPLPSR